MGFLVTCFQVSARAELRLTEVLGEAVAAFSDLFLGVLGCRGTWLPSLLLWEGFESRAAAAPLGLVTLCLCEARCPACVAALLAGHGNERVAACVRVHPHPPLPRGEGAVDNNQA